MRHSTEEKLLQFAETALGTIYCNPLVPTAIGVVVLTAGSIFCEWRLAMCGGMTAGFQIGELATMFLGIPLWLGYLLWCFDFNSDEFDRRSHLVSIMPPVRFPWLFSFMFSTLICVVILGLVIHFETTYIKRDPSEFVWSADMIRETIHWGRYYLVVAGASFLALLYSSFRAAKDNLADSRGRSAGEWDVV